MLNSNTFRVKFRFIISGKNNTISLTVTGWSKSRLLSLRTSRKRVSLRVARETLPQQLVCVINFVRFFLSLITLENFDYFEFIHFFVNQEPFNWL